MPAKAKSQKQPPAKKSKSKEKAVRSNAKPGMSQQSPVPVPGNAPLLKFPNAQTDKMSNHSKIFAQSDAQQDSAPVKLVASAPSKFEKQSAQSQQAQLNEEAKGKNANEELEAEFQANNQSEPLDKKARKRKIGEVQSPRSMILPLDPVGSSEKDAKGKAFEPWLEVQTTVELNPQMRIQLMKILDSYKYEKDRKQAVQHKGDFDSYLEQSKNMELPNLIWSFEEFKYDQYLLELASKVPNSNNFFSPLVFFELVFAKANDRTLYKLYDSDATKGFKQLRKNIVDIKQAQICPNCGALAHQMRNDSRHTQDCINKSASHSGLEVPKICNDYVCPLCMRMFRSLSQATIHIATHPWLMIAPFGWNARRLLCRMKNEDDRNACIQQLDLPELMAPEPDDGKVNRLSRENPGYFLRHFSKKLRYNHSEDDHIEHEEQPQLLQSPVSRHSRQEQNYALSYYANNGNQRMHSLTTLVEGLDIAFDVKNYLPQVDPKYNELFVGTFGGSVVLHYSAFYLTLIRGGIFQVLCSLNMLKNAQKTNKKLAKTYPMLSARIANGALEVYMDIQADPCLQIFPILHGSSTDKSERTTAINILQSKKLFTSSYDLYLLLCNSEDLTTTELWRPGHYWEFTRKGQSICLWLGLHCFFNPMDSEEMTNYCTFFLSWADRHKFYEPDEDCSSLLFWQQLGVIGLLLDDPFKKFTWVLGDTTMSSKHTCLTQKDKQFPQLFESFAKLAKRRLKVKNAVLAKDDYEIEESLTDCVRWCEAYQRFEATLKKPHWCQAINTLLDQTRFGFLELFAWLHQKRHQKLKVKQNGKPKAKSAQSATLSDIKETLALVVPCLEKLDKYTASISYFQIEEMEKRWQVREKEAQDFREVDVEKIDEAPEVLVMSASDEKKEKKG